MTRLAVITTHPIQYYGPWFRELAKQAGLTVRVFYLWDFGVVPRTDPGFLRPVVWDVPLLEGYDHVFVPNRSRWPGTHHFLGIHNPELPRYLGAWGPTAVLCLGYKYSSFFHLLATWDIRRAPLLLRGDSHRLAPRKGLREGLRRWLLAALFRRFGAFLYVGSANRGYYRLHNVPVERLFFSPHAVDNRRFQDQPARTAQEAREWRRSLGIPDTDRVILFVGKFEPKKRPTDLVDAFARARLPRTTLLLVGAGNLEMVLRQRAAAVPGVLFAPFQNQSQMPRTYAAADCLVLPSYGPAETWGLCVNEAMCLGRPAIVSSHVGCGPDLVGSGNTGLIFPAGNIDALTRCLREAIQDGERLRRWGEAAKQLVRDYSYEQSIAGLRNALTYLGR